MKADGSTATDPTPHLAVRRAIRSQSPGAVGWRTPALIAIAGVLTLSLRGVFEIGSRPTSNVPDAEAFIFEPSATSPLLIFGATLWMLARRSNWIAHSLGAQPMRAAGALALVAGTGLAFWSWAVAVPDFLLPALSCLMIGSSLWLGGIAMLRVVWLPAVFLLFAYPLPVAFVNHVVYPLQLLAARVATEVLQLAGQSVLMYGDRIAFRNVVFHVIESCSGLRGTMTIFMSAVLYVELFHKSRLRSILIVAASPLIGLFINQVRVLTIVLNPYASIASVHMAQGLLMIVVAVLMLALLDSILDRVLPTPSPRPVRRPTTQPLPSGRLVVLAGLSVALLAGSFFVERPSAKRLSVPLSRLPAELEGKRAKGLSVDRQFLGSTTFRQWVHRRYGEGMSAVEVFIAADDGRDGGVGFLSPKILVLDTAWDVAEQGWTTLADGREIRWLDLRSSGSRKLAWHWTVGVESPAVEFLRGITALDRSRWARERPAVVVRLATPLPLVGGPQARLDAEARLVAMHTAVTTSLGEISPDLFSNLLDSRDPLDAVVRVASERLPSIARTRALPAESDPRGAHLLGSWRCDILGRARKRDRGGFPPV